jgi:hypothetical protein
MMSNGANERLKIYTQHVPLRQEAGVFLKKKICFFKKKTK